MGNHATKLETQLKEQKLTNENLQQEINKFLMKGMNMQSDIDHLNAQNFRLEKKLTDRERDSDLMKIEIQK